MTTQIETPETRSVPALLDYVGRHRGLYDHTLELQGTPISGKTMMAIASMRYVDSQPLPGLTEPSSSLRSQTRLTIHGKVTTPTGVQNNGHPTTPELLSFPHCGERFLLVSYPQFPADELNSSTVADIYLNDPLREFLATVHPFRTDVALARNGLLDTTIALRNNKVESADLRATVQCAYHVTYGWPAERFAECGVDGLAEFLADERLKRAHVERTRGRRAGFRIKGPGLPDEAAKRHLDFLCAVAERVVDEERLDLEPIREVVQSLPHPKVIVTHKDHARVLPSVWSQSGHVDPVFQYMLGPNVTQTSSNCIYVGNVEVKAKPRSNGDSPIQVIHVATNGAKELLDAVKRDVQRPLHTTARGPSDEPTSTTDVCREDDAITAGSQIKESVFHWVRLFPIALLTVVLVAWAWEANLVTTWVWLGWSSLMLAAGVLGGVMWRGACLPDRWTVEGENVQLRKPIHQSIVTEAEDLQIHVSWIGRWLDVGHAFARGNRIRRWPVPQLRRFLQAAGIEEASLGKAWGLNVGLVAWVVGLLVLLLLTCLAY